MAKINVNLETFCYICGGQDHTFAAERVGLDLDACRDDEVLVREDCRVVGRTVDLGFDH